MSFCRGFFGVYSTEISQESSVFGEPAEKRQRAAALQDAVARFSGARHSARFWTAPALWRFAGLPILAKNLFMQPLAF